MVQDRDYIKSVIKSHFFNIRDYLIDLRDDQELKINKRDISVAITNLETSQMWAVRSLFSGEQVKR